MASEPDLSQMTDDEIYAYYGVDNPNREQTADNAESPVGSAQFQNQGQPQVSEEDLAAVKADSFDGDVSPVAEGFKTFFGSLFTGQGRKDAMDNYRLQTRSGGKVAKTAGYLSDLGNAFYQGLLGGASHVTEAVGNLTGWDDLADESKRYREKLAEYAPTDMTDTGALDENGVPRKRSWGDRIAETGKDVMRIMGEFAPAAASGGTTMAARAAGSAASWGLVGAGGVNTGFDIYRTTVENAEKNGLSKAEAVGLGIAGGAIDVFANAFLMGKFTGKGAKPIEEKFFQTFIKRQLGGAVKTGATMGASGGAQNVIQQMAENGEVDLEATGDAIIDSIIQGAMFHLMNGALHAPIEWSHYRTSQALNGRAADTASAAEDEAATEKMAESELGEYNAESIAVESARKVLGDEQGAAMFCNRYGDAAKEFIAARMRGADVPVEAAKDIGDLAKAFQTQEDMNAFGDRLLQYMNDAYSAKAEERAGWDRNLKNAEEEKKEETRKRVNGVDEEGVNAAFGGEQNARPSDMTRDSRIPRRVNQPNGHANTETNDHAVKIASDAERTHEEGGRIPRRINQPRGNRAEEGDPQTVMRAEEARNTDAEADEARAFGEDVSVANEDYAGYYEWLGGREDTAAMRYAFSREQQQDNARRVIREMTAKRAEDAKAEPAEEVAEQKRDSESAKQSATEEAKAETSEPAAADPEKKSTLVRLVDAIKAGDGDVGRAVENELREEIRAGKVPTEAEIDAATDGMGDVAKNAIRKHIGQMEDAAKAETSKTAETDAKTPEGESAPVQAKTNAEVREDAYNAWLKRQVGKSGKPKKDSKSMRMQFDKMVTDGKVDAKTGEDVKAKADAGAEDAKPKTPDDPAEEAKTDSEVREDANADAGKFKPGDEVEFTHRAFDPMSPSGKRRLDHIKGRLVGIAEDGSAYVSVNGKTRRFPLGELRTVDEYKAEREKEHADSVAYTKALEEGRVGIDDAKMFGASGDVLDGAKGDWKNGLRGAMFKAMMNNNNGRLVYEWDGILSDLRKFADGIPESAERADLVKAIDAFDKFIGRKQYASLKKAADKILSMDNPSSKPTSAPSAEMEMDTPVEFDTVGEDGKPEHVKGAFQFVDEDGMAVVDIGGGRMRKYAAKDVKAVKADTKDDAKDEKTPVAEQAKDESPSAQSTDLASLGAKAKVAQAKLKSLAIKTDAELMKHRAMLDKMGKKEMVEAIDDLIAYRKASRGGEAKHVAKNTDEPKTEAKKTGATYEKKVERIVDAFKSDGQRGIADAVMDLTKEEASKLANSVESRNVKGLETAGVGGLAKYIRAMHGLDLVDGRPAREWTVKKTEKGYIATNGTVSSQEFTGKNAKYKADNYANEFNLRNPVHGPVGVEGTERTPEQLKADEADAKLRLRDAKRTAKNEKKQLVDAIDRRIDLETSGESVQPLMVEVESKRELLRIAEEAGDRNRIARAKEDLDNALRSIRVGEGPIKIGNAEYSVRNLKQLMDLRDNIEKKYGRNITRFNSRTVGDASADDPALLDRLGKRMAKLVPGIKVKVGELSDGAKASGAVAEFDPKTGEVVVSKDASMSDVVHEIGGHGTFEWAKKNAPALYRKCLEYVRTAPKEVKDFVYENYGDFSPDKLVHEIFANRFAREHGAEFQKLLEEPKPRKWWTNILNAVRSVFQDAARRNGVDTSKLRGMDADGFMKGVAEQMAMGREMNGWTAFGRDAKYLEGAGVKVAPVGGGDNENDETLNSRAANQYDERTEDGRRFNEKYADADVSDAHVGKSAVDKLGAGGKELDATLAARRANAGEEKDGVLLYSRSGLRGDGGVEQDILRHEKERFGDGEARKRGMETIAVVRDGDFVYKYRDARTGLENERTKVARHNELFGDKTPYEIVDFASDKDGEVLVLKQPYVDFVPKSGNIARKQLEAYLRRRFGKVEVSEDGTEMRAGGWIVDDLKDANVGVDAKTGRYAVIDALVHRAEDFGGNAPKMDTADGGERGGATVIGPGVEDGADGGKLYSRVRHPLPSGLSPDRQYMDRERTGKESVRDSYMTNLADRYHRVKSALVDAKMADGMTRAEAEAWATNSKDSPYHQQRVLSGKTEKDMVRARAMESDFRDDLKAIANAGLDSDDVGVFAYAMHAKDRNAQKLADHGVKDGSGISDALADDIVNGRAFSLDGGKTTKQYTPAQLKELARVHDRIVHAMNDEYGLDYLREHGLIDEASVNRLKKAYGRNWVSLADDISEDGVDYNVGTSVSNPLKKAKGRTSVLEDNPVITSMLGMMNNIVNARRNDSANTLARFVEAHPEMGEVRPMTPTDKVDDATIVFRRNNEDPKTGAEKNQKMVIVLHGNRGAEVARSFSDADVSRAPGWLQNASRWWASFATQLSPTFSVRNFLKDTMEVTLDTMGTDGVGAAASFLKGQIAMLPIRNNEFRRTFVEWQRTGKVTGTSQLAQDFKKFVDSGALIGGGGAREGYAEANASAKDIARRVGGAQGAFRKAGELVDWYTDKVGTVNESIETLTRFNNFRNRIARDETPEQAAINSREGSTDFGMYGNQRWMNSVWMFSNSILGGTMRAAKTMKVGKYGPRLAAGMIAFGMLEEFANAAMGGDDDRNDASGGRAGKNVSEYDRENSIRLRVGDQFVKVPVHLGPWSVLKYTGGNVARALMGQISWNQALVNSTNSAATVLSHFSGTGEKGFGKDSPSLVNSMTPSVFQPLVQVGMNENYKGDKIHREHDMGDAKYAPDFKYAKKGTGSLWVELSRALNSISGGSDLVKGRMSVPPEDIEYFVKQIVKNFGTDVVNTFVETPSLAYEIATGKTKLGDPDSLRRVPVVKDVVKSVPDIANRYYEAVNAHAEERQAYRAAQGREKAEYLKAHPAAAANLRKFEDRIKRLSSLARGEITDKHGKVVRTYEPTLKRKEELRAAIRKQMANYLRLARKQ